MFPKNTEFGKRIPKTKFYENLELSKGTQKNFVKDIESIIWSNKLAPSTLNIPAGETVEEIQVFTVTLKSGVFSKDVLKAIDEQIPYHILFIVVCDGRYSAWISYKVKSRGKSFKVISYYNTGRPCESLPELRIEGINLDDVYKNFMKQISTSDGETVWDDNKSVEENVKQIEYIKKIKAEIEKLEIKKLKESQPNKKLELHQRINKLKEDIL